MNGQIMINTVFFTHRVLKRRADSLQLRVNVHFFAWFSIVSTFALAGNWVYDHVYHIFNTFLGSASGPKLETVADFWRMIWEQKTATIVMLTNLKERKEVRLKAYSPCTAFFWCYQTEREPIQYICLQSTISETLLYSHDPMSWA